MGFLADRFGRRTIFTLSLLWYMAASAIMAFQTTAPGLVLWRFLAGVGVGVELVTIDTYIAEIVPKEFRGRAFALNQIVQFSAIPIVAFLAWLLVPEKPFGMDGWRIVVLIGSLGAGVVWWIRLRCPKARAGSRATGVSKRRTGSSRNGRRAAGVARGCGDRDGSRRRAWPLSRYLPRRPISRAR